MKRKSNNFAYSKPLFYLTNFIFFFTRIIINFFYYIFVWPVKKLIKLYNFMIQVNITLRIVKKLRKVFELDLKNFACENNLGSGDIKTLLKSFNFFENKRNHPEIIGSVNDNLCTFDYNYRGIELNITKSFKKKVYIIEMKLNNKPIIDIEKEYDFRRVKYPTLFF